MCDCEYDVLFEYGLCMCMYVCVSGFVYPPRELGCIQRGHMCMFACVVSDQSQQELPQHGPYYRQPWEGLKETTPIISGGMNALLLSAFLDEPQGNQVFCQMNKCIPELVKAMRVCIKETGVAKLLSANIIPFFLCCRFSTLSRLQPKWSRCCGRRSEYRKP